MPRFGRVVLGGTFDRLHVGHEALLSTAFREGRSVAIGVTTDGYLERHPKPASDRIAPYRLRRAALVRWLAAHYPRSRWTVVPLEDTFGRSVEDGVDALILSADTRAGGRAVNAERRRRGRDAVPLVVVPLVLGDDLEPVSSRRIRAGAIDRRGRRVGPIRVALAVDASEDRGPSHRGIRRAFPRARIVPLAERSTRRRTRTTSDSGPELTIVVHGRGDRRRTVNVAARSARLAPTRWVGRFPRDLESRLARLLGRSRGPKPFKAHRR